MTAKITLKNFTLYKKLIMTKLYKSQKIIKYF